MISTSCFLAAFALLCLAIERLRPGWRLPRVPGWHGRMVLLNAIQISTVIAAGGLWEKQFQKASLFQLDGLHPLAGGAFAYFVATFVFYWWHRLRHESDWLWRLFHQIHHSPRRLELATSFYKHPLEMAVNSAIGAALVYGLLGLSSEAGAAYTLCTALGEFFYHTNVRTYRWVGFVFQRPEMHRIHHQYGRHKNNYGDVVWWDMIFGTYENPESFDATCGFDPEKEEDLGRMLAFEDANRL